ncbi:UDP-glycosyltransferase 71A16 [Camellia lanceoleosa]|uniref:UDP-glycosyltransferase 71A16 n=1 Tax=Camellia lanceoleosa TaxID=1840588 RepID=A0ACC0HGH4_9ERIC|nr:UDP-glycosyltransferase 71A16 [Camellia lanceoleosa]
MSKAQLVFIPSPGIGHLASTVEMAKLLVGRDDRLSVTVLIMKFPFDNKGTTTQSLSSDRIRFLDLFHDTSSTVDPNSKTLFLDCIENHKTPVRDVVSEIVSKSESESTPRLAGFVIDMFCTSMIDVANEFGVPTYVFFTSSAGFLGLMFHIDTLQQDITELKDSDAELNVPAYANPVPAKVLPSVLFDKEVGFTMFLNISKRCRETEGIIVNTFTELEFHALKSLADDHTIPKIYPVGPVLNLKGGSPNEPQNSQSEADIMRWLDNQDPSSVVFLCFGSMGSFDGEQVKEIARALESCGHRFLWSLRQPPPKGNIELPKEYENPTDVLPEGFLDRTAEIGKVIGWAPQVAVLSHRAVGGFVSHCGWNSTLESLWCGVPVATWPMYAEQQMNAFQLVREFGMAVEIKMDYRKDFGMKEMPVMVTAEEISSGIRRLMDGSDEIKHKVKKMSEKSTVAVTEGGSSYNSLGCFIEDVIKG